MLVIKIDKFERIKKRHLFVQQTSWSNFVLLSKQKATEENQWDVIVRTHGSEVQSPNVNPTKNGVQCIETKIVIHY